MPTLPDAPKLPGEMGGPGAKGGPEAPGLLEVRNLHAGYGETRVLHGIDFAVEQGGVTALLGANGAGKTTTLRAICGMLRRSGEIRLGGERIDAVATEDIVRRGVAHVPDGRGTFLELTVEENLRLGAYTRPKQAALADIRHMFDYFPRLQQRLHQQAGTLSGGEQQMLAIARALVLRPRLLLLDEPSFGLAPLIVAEIFVILRRIRAEEGVSILLVEQNASLALDFADHAYLLETGRIVVAGRAEEIRRDEAVRRSYLGY
jgi:branched-chain amino acid transport system ATP-binding protein